MSDGQKRPTGPSRRTERMSDLIKEEIASYLIKGNKNPRIGFVTITSVKMTPDLQRAWVYYSAYGSIEEVEETRQGLEESATVIRTHLARNLKLRHIPKIEFYVDEGLEHSLRVQTLLGSLHKDNKE